MQREHSCVVLDVAPLAGPCVVEGWDGGFSLVRSPFWPLRRSKPSPMNCNLAKVPSRAVQVTASRKKTMYGASWCRAPRICTRLWSIKIPVRNQIDRLGVIVTFDTRLEASDSCKSNSGVTPHQGESCCSSKTRCGRNGSLVLASNTKRQQTAALSL
jgi:hypothetical protein